MANNAGELIVKVNVKLEVSKREAEAALKIVELYVNNNGADILSETQEDGSIKYKFSYWGENK